MFNAGECYTLMCVLLEVSLVVGKCCYEIPITAGELAMPRNAQLRSSNCHMHTSRPYNADDEPIDYFL